MKEENVAEIGLFERIRYWKEFRREATHIFQTDGALRWFIRCHEGALVAAGGLLKLPRGNYIDPGPFRAAAIELMLKGAGSGSGVAAASQSSLEKAQENGART